jgi:hypothetical protein
VQRPDRKAGFLFCGGDMGLRSWMWKRVAHPLAAYALRLGVTRRQAVFNTMCLFFPKIVQLAVALEELRRPESILLWIHESAAAGGEDAGVEDLLADVAERIDRAGTPLGGDNYIILVVRLGALPSDPATLAEDAVEDSLDLRPVLQVRKLSGNRWMDWKKGEGKGVLRQILQEMTPIEDAPVVVIQSAVIGAAYSRLYSRFTKG